MNKIRLGRSMLALTLLLALLLSLSPAAAAANYNNSAQDLKAARQWVAEYSYFDLAEAAGQAGNMESLMTALMAADPYASYMTAGELAASNSEYYGTYVGIGIMMELNGEKNVAVRCVYGDTIAAQAGIRRGDVIYSIDGVSTLGKSINEVHDLLSGKDGSIFNLVLQRGENLIPMDIKRGELTVPAMYYWVEEGGIGYLKITRFTDAVDEQLKAALNYLPELGATSLLLDLRDCPGGLMDAAADCCALLTGGGPIYYRLDRSGYRSVYVADENPLDFSLPLAVLVNEHTASAAEMTAAVVQDAGAGTVIGSGTYGKGYFQTVLTLPSGASIHFTIGKYVTWGRQDIAEQGGVTPDMLVADADQQDRTAAGWLKTQQAVPGELRFQFNSRNALADGSAWLMSYAPISKDGRAYVAAAELLTKLGWELNYYQNKCYAFNGVKRLIFEQGGGALTSGRHQDTCVVVNKVVYIPVAFLGNLGYGVTWDAASSSVVVSR